MPERTREGRPTGNRTANQEHSAAKFKDTSIVADSPAIRDLIEQERAAAYAAGVQAGIAQGRAENIKAEVGAFSTAGALVDWAMHHHLSAVAHGTSYADYVAGDIPSGGGRRE